MLRRIMYFKKYYNKSLGNRDRLLLANYISNLNYETLEHYADYCLNQKMLFQFQTSYTIQNVIADKLTDVNTLIYMVLCRTEKNHPNYNKLNYATINFTDMKSTKCYNCIDDYLHIFLSLGDNENNPKYLLYDRSLKEYRKEKNLAIYDYMLNHPLYA